ncbi:MAG: outer membrane protein assembly factor BamC [Betaproteobacteria bacterium]|nr:outer membrane protein assembly factor BamC [Betaproteobacteria bacterium]
MLQLRLKMIFAALAATLLLAACSAMPKLEGDKIEYKSAGRLPPLEIPPDLTRPTADDRYIVPDINPKGQATFSAYSKERTAAPDPSKSTVLPSQENARIERSGSQRWLVVRGEPDAVWNVVKEFWQETGFIIRTEHADAGVMETDWAENRAKLDAGVIRNFLSKVLDSVYSTAERDKFRTRLERGSEPATTEIYISHRGMEEVYTSASQDQTKWQPRPPDPDLEAEMLRRLMTRFGVQQDRARVEVAAAQAPARATLLKGQDGAGTLSVKDQFDRAWRRVGLALDRVGFTVEDRDRSKGLYFVRYVDPDADNRTAQSKGFFSKLNPFRSSDKKPGSEQFRIQVKDADSVSQVSVLNKDGNQEKSETANRILSLLYEQLK